MVLRLVVMIVYGVQNITLQVWEFESVLMLQLNMSSSGTAMRGHPMTNIGMYS